VGGGAVFLAAGGEENAGDEDGNDDGYDDERGSNVHEEVSLRTEYQMARTGAERDKKRPQKRVAGGAAFGLKAWQRIATVGEK
jgi:hypothetical protein